MKIASNLVKLLEDLRHPSFNIVPSFGGEGVEHVVVSHLRIWKNNKYVPKYTQSHPLSPEEDEQEKLEQESFPGLWDSKGNWVKVELQRTWGEITPLSSRS